MYCSLNLKELIYELRNTPIWLRYVTIRKNIIDKYPDLSHSKVRYLADRIISYVKDFIDYKFCCGTEYLLSEVI